MAITYVSSFESNVGNTIEGDYVDVTVNIGTRTNGLLLVMVANYDSNVSYASAATYNSVSMTRDTYRSYAAQYLSTTIFSLANPSNGSNTLRVTFSGALYSAHSTSIYAAWFDGALQTSPTDQVNNGEGTTDPSLVITPTQNGDVIVSVYYSQANGVLTVGSGETLIQDHSFGPRTTGCSYVIQTTAAAQTMDWAGTDDYWCMCVAAYKEVAGAAAYVPYPFSRGARGGLAEASGGLA